MVETSQSTTFRRARLALTACLLVCTAAWSHGQSEPAFSPAAFDPSDVYFQGYLAARTAEQMEAAGDHVRAAEKYRKAGEMFGSVLKYYPNWKPEMVGLRAEKTREALANAEDKARKQLEEKRQAVAELEGGVRVPGQLIDPAALVDSTPQVLKVDPVAARRLKEAEQEVARLKAELLREIEQRKQAEHQSLTHNQQSSTEIEKIQNQSEKELAIAQAEIRRLRKEALLDKARADTEIKRLMELSGEAERNSRDKIRQLQELSANAYAKAEEELKRMQDLSGEERRRAEAESQRLSRLAAEARKNADKEIAKIKQMTDESRQDVEVRLQKAREQAATAQAVAEARQQELDQSNQRNATIIRNLKLRDEQLQAKLQAAETTVTQLRARLASVPVESEVLTLNHRIKQLEQERSALSTSLRQTQSGYSQAMEKIGRLEAEQKQSQQRIADLTRDLDAERNASNSVVAGQRRQIEALQKELEQSNANLALAHEQINGLKRELQESHDAYAQIKQQRDALLVERDQLAAALNMSKDGRIQELIEQNVNLNKQLREAEAINDRLFRENNADKDTLTEALRDLAIAKSQINRLHQEMRDQNQRIAELEDRLVNEEKALANAETTVNPAEADMLREMVRRTLRAHKCRVQARDLLLQAAKRLGQDDPELQQAVDLLDQQELALTPEEQKLIADRDVDGEFISPFARDRSAVGRSTAALNEEIAIYERTARKSFLAGRLLPTRELYEMVLDQNPGHVPTLCKLGVVHLKLNEPTAACDRFRRAVELDNHNPYALRMLAYSLMKSGNLSEAEPAARESVRLEPNDDKTHILLATLCYRLGHQSDAEAHFKGAINANPLPSEPYYNLALIYSSTGKIDKAREYYHQALERGAVPDPQLEQTLSIQ